ncbi:MAG: DUF2163 domain-containing protein [Rhodothalassiaceae bacterium]
MDRRDGVRLGLTLHDRPLWIDGLHYQPLGGTAPSAISADAVASSESVSIGGGLVIGGIARSDLLAGLYDHAQVHLFLVDWQQPQAGTLPLFSGTLGEVRLSDERFEADLQGLAQALEQLLAPAFSPECRAQLGDKRCKVPLRRFTQSARVVTVSARDDLTIDLVQSDGWFSAGLVRFWTGPNAGRTMEIAEQTGPRLRLFQPLPAVCRSGDRVALIAGCDKRLHTCRSKFDNSVNFRGEPFVPGADAVLAYPSGR